MGSDALVFLLGGSAMGGFLWLVRKLNDGIQARRQAEWEKAAKLLDGDFTPFGRGRYARTPARVRARIATATIVADSYEESQGKSSVLFTRIVGTARAPAGFDLQVHTPRPLESLTKVFGAQDIEVGDPPFDDAFIVKCSNPELARRWLSPQVRAALARIHRYECAFQDGRLTAVRKGFVDNAECLVEDIRIVAALANRGEVLLAEWQSFARALGGDTRDAASFWNHGVLPEIAVERHGSIVTVTTGGWIEVSIARTVPGEAFLAWRHTEPEPVAARDAMGLGEAAAAVRGAEDPFALAYDLRSADPASTAERLTGDVRDALVRSGAQLRGEKERFVASFPAGVVSAECALAAVDVISTLGAGGGIGPYR